MGAGWYIQVRFCRQDICSVDNWNFSLISAIILSNSETLTPRAQNLRQGIVLKTSFKTRVSRMGLGSFVNVNIFVIKYNLFQFVYLLHFFKSHKSKSTQMLNPKKETREFHSTILFLISGSVIY